MQLSAFGSVAQISGNKFYFVFFLFLKASKFYFVFPLCKLVNMDLFEYVDLR